MKPTVQRSVTQSQEKDSKKYWVEFIQKCICTMSVNRLKILRRFIGKIYLKNEDGLPDA